VLGQLYTRGEDDSHVLAVRLTRKKGTQKRQRRVQPRTSSRCTEASPAAPAAEAPKRGTVSPPPWYTFTHIAGGQTNKSVATNKHTPPAHDPSSTHDGTHDPQLAMLTRATRSHPSRAPSGRSKRSPCIRPPHRPPFATRRRQRSCSFMPKRRAHPPTSTTDTPISRHPLLPSDAPPTMRDARGGGPPNVHLTA